MEFGFGRQVLSCHLATECVCGFGGGETSEQAGSARGRYSVEWEGQH